MGAYISKIDDNNLVKSVIYKGHFRKGEDSLKKQFDDNAKTYKNFLHNHGFYRINLDEDKLLKYIENNVNLLEAFNTVTKDNEIIESFSSKMYKDKLKPVPMMINLISGYGFFAIREKREIKQNSNKPQTLDDIEIILPKMYMYWGKYKILIDFIFDKNFKTKETSESKKKELDNTKNMVKHVFDVIHNRNRSFAEIIINNIFGIIIKMGIIITLKQAIDKESGSAIKERMNNILFKIIVEDLINVIPDDKCYLLEPDMDFFKIDPLLCKYDKKSYYERLAYKNIDSLTKCNEDLDTCKSETNKNYKLYRKYRDKSAIWRMIAIGFIILFITFLVLYIMKKCDTKIDDGNEVTE